MRVRIRSVEEGISGLLAIYILYTIWHPMNTGFEFIYSIMGVLLGAFVPGILILGIIGIQISSAKQIAYSLSISLIWTMAIGTSLSLITWGFEQVPPLLTPGIFPYLFSLSVVPLILWSSRIEKQGRAPRLTTIRSIGTSKILIITLSLPILGSIGAVYINRYSSNLILISSLVLFSTIPVMYVGFRKSKYSLAVWALGLSMALQNAIIDTNLKQGDAMLEFIIASRVLQNGTWDPQLSIGTAQMLRLAVLHPAFQLLTGLDLWWEFKLVHPFLLAFIPICIYFVSTEVISSRWAFLAACAYISMHPFFNLLSRNTRTGTAILFMAVCGMAIIDDTITGFQRKFLIIGAALGVFVSHYGVAPMLLSVLAVVFVLSKLARYLGVETSRVRLQATTLTLIILLFFFWYMYTSGGANFKLIASVAWEAVSKILLEPTSPSEGSSAGAAFGIPMPSVTFKIIWTEYILIGLIATIVVAKETLIYALTKKRIDQKQNTQSRLYLLFLAIGGGIILLFAFGPFGMGIARVYMIGILFLVPYTFLGIKTITRYIAPEMPSLYFVSVLIGGMILINSGVFAATVTHDVSPQPNLDRDWIENHGSDEHLFYLYRYYVPDTDTRMTNWLMAYGERDKKIYSTPSPEVKGTSLQSPPTESDFTIKYITNHKCSSGEYLYIPSGIQRIGEIPKVDNLRFLYYSGAVDLTEYKHENTIYSNGGRIHICVA